MEFLKKAIFAFMLGAISALFMASCAQEEDGATSTSEVTEMFLQIPKGLGD